VRLWDDGVGNFFGRLLYAADPSLYDTRVALGNAGVVGFNNSFLVRAVNDIVRMIACRQDPERLRIYTDQPILNYVLHKIDLGDFELLNRYCRLTRTINEVPPTERRGIVHFHLASGGSDAFEKAFAMRSYFDAVLQHVGERGDGDVDVDISLSIPGQMAPVELDRLARLARGVPPNGCIVEVGSLFGLSSWALAKNASPSVTVYCIDPWVSEPWMLPLEEQASQVLSFESFRNNVASISNIIPLPGYSPRDFIGWQRTIDLVFEDSVHTNPLLHENLSFWARLVRAGGVICGHDYCDEFPDVKTEVDRLAAHFGIRVEITGTLWSMRVPDDRTVEDVRTGA
jgi:predicted O-methyltransferase YrrM